MHLVSAFAAIKGQAYALKKKREAVITPLVQWQQIALARGRILQRWTHRTSAAAFDSWHAHAHEQVI